MYYFSKLQKKGTLLLTGAFMACYSIVGAQTAFVRQLGGNNEDFSYDLITDGNGDIIICGSFSKTADFDPSNNTYQLASNGQSDAFVAKYNPAGILIWALQFGGGKREYASCVTIDAANNIYVGGQFEGVADFDPTSQVKTLRSFGSQDIFMLKINTSGKVRWVKQIGGTGKEQIEGIKTNGQNNLYISGFFEDRADFDPSPGVAEMTPANLGAPFQEDNSFFGRYDLNGNYIWVKNIGGKNTFIDVGREQNGSDYIMLTNCGDANAVTPVDYDPSESLLQPVTGNQPDAAYFALVKYDGNGALVWAEFFRGYRISAGNPDNVARDIIIDADRNIYLGGAFLSNFPEYPGTTLTLTRYGAVGKDGFLIKFDKDGNVLWEKKFGAPNLNDGVAKLALDAGRQVHVTGIYQGTAEMNSAGESHTVTSKGYDDMFVAGFTASGNYLYSGTAGGNFWSDGGTGIAASGNRIVASGNFFGIADCDLFAPVQNLRSFGLSDIFFTAYESPLSQRPAELQTSNVFQTTSVGITLSPNPAKHVLYVTGLDHVQSNLTITNVMGQVMINLSAHTGNYTIQTGNLPRGVYYVNVSDNKKTARLQFIKQE